MVIGVRRALHGLRRPSVPPAVGSRAAGPAAAVLLTVLVLAGCGIPNGGAKAIPTADVPFHLLDPATTSTTTQPGPPAVGVAETIFLVAPDQQHVTPVVRDVPVPASLTQILGALLAGPTSVEQASGIATFVSGNRNQVTASASGGVATVNFATNPVQLVGPDLTLAIAQIVYTVTQQPQVTVGVVFHIGGQPIEVPVASGAQVPGPVNRLDYLTQAPVG
jgi:spore germination protein GerM